MTKKSKTGKRILSILLTLVLTVGMVPATSMTATAEDAVKCAEEGCSYEYDNGKCYNSHLQEAVLTTDKYDVNDDGIMDTVYEIGNGGQLLWFAQKVNGGEVYLNAVLTADITMLLDAWPAIGSSSKQYAGHFDGKNHTITCNTTAICATDYYGLFGYSNGTIKNVKVMDFLFTSTVSCEYVGALCGYNMGTISNCSFENSAGGNNTQLKQVGGIAGYNGRTGVISSCTTDTKNGAIRAIESVGGIVGFNYGSIENCTSKGVVTATGQYVGGIVGQSYGYVKSSSNYATIGDISNIKNVGGIAGYSGWAVGLNGGIENCINYAKIEMPYNNQYVGGIVGQNGNRAVTGCVNTADIVAKKAQYVGCIAGCNYDGGTISACFNSGSISGSHIDDTYTVFGGITGYNDDKATINNCVNVGSVLSKQSGGLAGRNFGTISHSCFAGTLVNTSCSVTYWNNKMVDQIYYTTGKTIEKVYGTATQIVKVTDEQIKSGEVTYLLNDQKTDEDVIWRQTSGTDNYPVPYKTSLIVYATYPCISYTNTKPTGDKEHNYERGVCTNCQEALDLPLNADGFYEINDLEELLTFADHVNAGQCSVNAKLNADIDASSVAYLGIGKNTEMAYKGTFDGNGKTLKLNLTSREDYTAPFLYVNGATIRNLTVAGTITTTHKFASGIVGRVTGGSVTLEGCISRVDIISNMGSTEAAADGTHGGLVGVAGSGTLNVIRCAFLGSITGENTTSCGGIVGWSDVTTSITDSYVAAAFSLKDNSGNTFARNKVALTNCYYQNALSGTPSAGATQKNKEAFSSGEVTWLLNGKSADGAWKQTLGADKDDYPNFTGKTVYGIPTDCGGKNASGYVNTEQTALLHSYDKNGLCRETEGEVHYQPAVYQDGKYEISNAGQLVWFADFVNTKVGDTYPNQNADAVLKCDIDLKNITGYVPIGGTTGLYYSADGTDKGYQGTFDGCGHVIRNLTVTGSGSKEGTYGVFGTLSGTVKHLGVEKFTFTVGSKDCRAGGLVGQMLSGSQVSDCYVANSTVSASGKVAGGLAGCNYAGTIENCHTYKVTVTATRKGGIVGDNRGDKDENDRKGTVRNCYTDNALGVQSSNAGLVEDSEYNVTEEIFASGSIRDKLNKESSEDATVWYQTLEGLGAQAFPQFHERQPIDEELCGYTLSPNGNIAVNFYMKLGEDLIEDPDAYMHFEPGSGEPQNVYVKNARTRVIGDTTYYIFPCEVAASEMTMKITATMFDGNGNVGESYNYTIQEYADYIINTDPDSYSTYDIQMAKAMLNYGTCAQQYFDVATDNLANKILTEEDQNVAITEQSVFEEYKSQGTIETPYGTFAGSSLVLKSETTLKVFFKPGEDFKGTFYIDGTEVTEYTYSDDGYIVLSVADIKAWDLDRTHEFTVSDGEDSYTYSCSPLTYAYNVLGDADETCTSELKKVVSAMYIYHQCAKYYVTKK